MTAHASLSPKDEVSPALDIYRQFRGLIVSGQLGAGERLPTVRQTASDLGVAAGTAAKAYRMLENEGLVVTRTAAGTRVAAAAAVLPAAVVRRVRDLATATDEAEVDIEDVIAVLRLASHAGSSASSTREKDRVGR